MKIRHFGFVLALTLLLGPGAALAQDTMDPVPPPPAEDPPPPPPPQYDQGQAAVTPQQVVIVQQAPVQPSPMLVEIEPTVHEGFFMRFNIGGTFTALGTSFAGQDLRVQGGGPLFSFAIGGSILPNLALYGELWSATAINPTIEVDGMSRGEADSLVVVAIGGGATYYLPNNLYLGLSVGYGAASTSSGGSDVGSTEGGVAFKGTVGYEWFMGTEWGIGVAGVVGFGRFPDGPADWNMGHAGIALSLTKN